VLGCYMLVAISLLSLIFFLQGLVSIYYGMFEIKIDKPPVLLNYTQLILNNDLLARCLYPAHWLMGLDYI
jgi:hypothetical protein